MLLFACLVSGQLCAQVPNIAKITLDSATSWLDYNIGDNDDTLVMQFGQVVLREAVKQGDDLQAAYAARHLAYWNYINYVENEQDSILKYDKLALRYFTAAGEVANAARSAGHVATDLSELNRFLEAEEILVAAIERAKPTQDTIILGKLYSDICYLYRNSRDYDTAIGYGWQAVQLFEELKGEDSLRTMVPLFYLAACYVNSDRPAEALRIAERTVRMVEAVGPDEFLGETIRAYGYRGEALAALGRLDEALRDHKYVYDFALKKLPEASMADGNKQGVGYVYYLQGKYKEAIPYLEDFITHMANRGFKQDETMIKSYRYLAESYANTGNLAKAIAYKDTAYHYKSQQLDGELKALRSELRVQYATEQKDALIDEQEDTISRQRKVQLLSYGIGLLLLLGALGLFFGLRNNRRKNALLEERNTENETLLKEIHHRVKNNLEVVSSLLELQSATLSDKGAQDAMLASRSRVKSMGILHQKLYQGRSLKSIEMREYLTQLASSLLETYNEKERLQIKVAAEAVDMDVDTAIPLGLIVNELLTNAIKYAYPADQQGTISVSLRQQGDGKYALSVSDQGQGQITATHQGTGFGSRLVDLLSRQIGAEVEQSKIDGFQTKLTYAYPPR